jgi:hypothetical protein
MTGFESVLEANPAAHAELLASAAQAAARIAPAGWDALTPRQRDELVDKGHGALVRAGGMTPRAWRALPFLSPARSAVLLAGAAEMGIPVGWIAPPCRQVGRDTAPASWDAAGTDTRPTASLTAREERTLRGLRPSRLAAVTRRLLASPEDGYLESGPGLRDEIARRVGRLVLHEVSAGRVVPLPDGIELPVTSSDYLVCIRRTAARTYEVTRVLARPGTEASEGERSGVSQHGIREAAWEASCFRSLGAGAGWAAGG